MKILVIGSGSIGMRHIRNLVALKAGEIYAFDTDAKNLKKAQDISQRLRVADSLEIVNTGRFDIIFITTPTALHLAHAILAAKAGSHLFIEKPLADTTHGLDILANVVKAKKLITMVGCNMRFYWAVAKVKAMVDSGVIGKIFNARVTVGQYLPDWRPGVDYRQTYCAKKSLGGGVILDAIHEIDYAGWLFGAVDRFTAIYGRLGDLEIDTEDTAEILIKYKNGPLVSIHQDYLERGYGRGCKAVGSEGTIIWDFMEHAVKVYLAKAKKWKIFKEPKGYALNDMYMEEIKYFLKCVKANRPTFNNIESAGGTLRLVLDIKRKGLDLN